tara:strand:- start:65 stop:1609 length:1545 start_codon:yes stop_codon:yes gene_type:complete
MAVPTSGILKEEEIAREAYYGQYGGNPATYPITPPISLYDMLNGGNANGSGMSYPALNRNCLPNPSGSLVNSNTEPCSNGMDVAFIIDYTGSMGSVIETVKSGISDVIDHIKTESSTNYRLGLVTVDEMGTATPNYSTCSAYTSLPSAQKYNNQGVSGKYQIITAWEKFSTNNETSFTSILDDLNGGVSGSPCIQLGYGYGTPEPTDIAIGLVINTATNFLNNFRSNAAKYCIILTDTYSSGGDDAWTEADYQQLQILRSTAVTRGVVMFVLGQGVNVTHTTTGGDTVYPWRDFAIETNGTWNSSYNTTSIEDDLTQACSNDGIFTPYKFSAWYGYDKDCTSGLKTFSSSQISNSSGVCSATINQTYYHDGSGSTPVANDTVYNNPSGTIDLAAGYYRISASQYIIVGASGNVTSVNNCVTLTGFNVGNPSAFVSDMCSQTAPGGNTYYHDGSGTYPVVNDIVYLSNSTSNPLDGGTGIQWPYFANGATLGDSPLAYFRITGSTGTVQAVTNCP